MSAIFPEVQDSVSQMFPEIYSNPQATQPNLLMPQQPQQRFQAPINNQAINLFLIRHALTEIDDQGRSHGWMDNFLIPKGHVEAQKMAEIISQVPLHKLYSSDLTRAQQTAYHIAGRTGIAPESTPELRPIDLGELSGLKSDEIQKKFASLLKIWKTNPDKEIPGGESYRTYEARNMGFLNRLISEHKPGDVVGIVGHSSTHDLYNQYSKEGTIKFLNGQKTDYLHKNGNEPEVIRYEHQNGKLRQVEGLKL